MLSVREILSFIQMINSLKLEEKKKKEKEKKGGLKYSGKLQFTLKGVNASLISWQKNLKNLNFADQPDAKKVAPQNDCK